MSELPSDAAERKRIPLCTGVLDYFPAALVEVAKQSQAGNDQHNPGEKLHWAREKSADHLDCALRHILERDLRAAAWRILAALQLQCEAEGAPIARGARESSAPLKTYVRAGETAEQTAQRLRAALNRPPR